MERKRRLRSSTEAVFGGAIRVEPVFREETPARSFAGLHCENAAVDLRARIASQSGESRLKSKLANACPADPSRRHTTSAKDGSSLFCRDVNHRFKDAPSLRRLDRDSATFQIADANDFIHLGEKNLSVSDLAGGGGFDNGVDGGAHLSVVEHDFDFHLG
jgi:hypothetical protein